MKIGLSFSRCVLDIVEGRVDIDDVLVVISRTDFDPRKDEQWSGIWAGYSSGRGMSAQEWSAWSDRENAENIFRKVAVDLFELGKLHQPRQFGARPSRRSEYWLETVLPDSELELRPAVKDAWDKFQMLAGLTNITLDKEYQ